MASVLDVAAYILKQQGGMTAMKLQKLVFYSQAWSLVWDEEPLFRHEMQAWANGPVAPFLYAAHRGQFKLGGDQRLGGSAAKLNATQRETIDNVLKFYGAKSGQWLSELTHRERPWLEARKGMKPGERGNVKITHTAMAEYYGSLL